MGFLRGGCIQKPTLSFRHSASLYFVRRYRPSLISAGRLPQRLSLIGVASSADATFYHYTCQNGQYSRGAAFSLRGVYIVATAQKHFFALGPTVLHSSSGNSADMDFEKSPAQLEASAHDSDSNVVDYNGTAIKQNHGVFSRLRNFEAAMDKKLGIESQAIERKLPNERQPMSWHSDLPMFCLWASGTMGLSCFATGTRDWLTWHFGHLNNRRSQDSWAMSLALP